MELNAPRPPWTLFVLIVVVYAVVDFMIPTVINAMAHGVGSMWVFLSIGFVLGQIAFLTVWAAMGPSRRWERWLLVLAAGLGLYAAFCLGVVMIVPHAGNDDLREMAELAMFIPLIFVVAQLPLWVRKSISGWRIVLAGDGAELPTTEDRQFTLADLLGLMVFVGAALSLAGIAVRHIAARTAGAYVAAYGAAPNDRFELSVWLYLAAVCGVVFVWNLVWIGPVTRTCLLMADKRAGCATMIVVWFYATSIVVFFLAIVAGLSPNPSDPSEVIMAVVVSFGGTIAFLAGTLHFLRVLGYTMVRVGVARPNADTEAPDVARQNDQPAPPDSIERSAGDSPPSAD